MKALQASLTLLTACTLAACGGGGSSGGDTQPPASTATITGVNFEAAASEGYAGAVGIVDANGATDLLLGVGSANTPSWKSVGLTQSKNLIALFGDALPELNGVSVQRSVACPNGGSLTISANDLNGNRQIDAGDSVSASFANCNDPSFGTGSGSFDLKFNAAPTGNIGGSIYSFDATVTLTNFRVDSAGASQVANGSLRLISQRTGLSTGADRLEASSFGTKETFGGLTSERSVSKFSASQGYSSVGVTTSVSGVISSSLLGGSVVVVQTSVPFVELNSDAYPYIGQLIVTGSQGGRAVFTALNASQVRLDLDTNGDGVADQSKTKSWNAIQ